MTNPKTEADKLFERYLDDHGYQWTYEPDWEAELGKQIPTAPDYLATRDGRRAVFEVKEVASTRILSSIPPGQAVVVPDKAVYGGIRQAIRDGARNLRPLKDFAVPLVLVLASPRGSDVELDPFHVIHASLGNAQVLVTFDPKTGEDAGPPTPAAGRDGVLARTHLYVSAVVALHEVTAEYEWARSVARGHGSVKAAMAAIDKARDRGPVPEGSRRWADVYDVSANGGQPLPRDFFAGERDKWYGMRPDGYGLLEER